MRRARRFLRNPPWWFLDIVIVLVVSALLSGTTYLLQDATDDRRASDALKSDERIANLQTRLANLQFVRDRSNSEITPRPFRSLDLVGQQLGGLQLKGSDFRDANLRDVDFRESDLTGADLAHSDLDGVVFLGTNLSGAQLIRYGLSSERDDRPVATFEGANLSHAKVLGMRIESLGPIFLNGTMLYGSDLSAISPKNLRQMAAVCYDESTRWPRGFSPPRSASDKSCLQGWLRVYYPSRGEVIPWEMYGLDPE